MKKMMNPFFRYVLALIFVVVALLLRLAVEKIVGPGLPTFITYYPAIMLSALVSGLGPGLAATAVSFVLADYFTITPYQFGHWSSNTAAGMMLFSGMGLFMCMVAHRYRRIHDNLNSMVEERTSELSRSNEALNIKIGEYDKIIGDLLEARRNAEKANTELETIFSAIQDALLIYDTGMVVKKANQTFINHYGFDPVGISVSDMIIRTRCRTMDGSPVPIEIQPTARALQGETVSNQKILITDDTGAEVVLETSSTPLIFDGSIAGTVTVWHDITEHIRAKDMIRRAKEEWEATFDSIPDLIAILDDQHRIVRINRSMANKVHLEPSQCIGLTCHSIMHGTDAPLGFCPHTQSLQDLTEHETVIVDGNTGESFMVSTTPLFDNSNGMYATVHVARDISLLKQIESALRESKNQLQLFIDHSPVALAMFDRDMRYLHASRRWLSDFGLGERDLGGLSHYDVFPEIPNSWKEVHRRAFAGEVIQENADRFERADGSVQWLRWEVRPWYDSRENVGGIVIFSEDISERVKIDEILRQSESRFRRIFDNVATGIAITDCSGRYVQCNNSYCSLLGYDVSELSAMNFPSIIHAEDVTANMVKVRELLDGEIPSFEVENRYIHKNGGLVWVHKYVSVLNDEHNKPTHIIALVTDMTERKQTEDALRFLGLCNVNRPSDDFFQELARYLSESLAMDYICIDRLEKDGLTARTVAVCHDGKFEDNVSYALKDTPCGEVVGQHICCYPRNVCDLFPNDDVLKDLAAECYLGTTLWDSRGEPIGLIAMIGRRPLADTKIAEAILQMVAVRAAGELERQQVMDSLQESEERLRFHLDNSPMAVIEWDKNFTITRWTGESERMFGWSAAETVGRPITDLNMVFEEDVPIVENTIARLTDGVTLQVVSTNRNFTKNQAIRHCTWYNSVLMDKQGQMNSVLSKVIDITDQVISEKRLDLLANTSSSLLASESPQELVDVLCNNAMEVLNCDVFFNFLVDEEQMRLHLNACAGIPKDERQKIEWLDYGVAICGCAARDARRIVAEDIPGTDDPRTDLVKSYGVKAYACHPLIAHGRVLGTLSFGTRNRNNFTIDEIILMNAVADLVAIAIERRQNLIALDKSRSELEARVEERTNELKISLDLLQQEASERVQAVEALRSQELLMIQQNRHAAMGEMIGNIAHQWRQPLNTLGLYVQRLGIFYGTPVYTKEFMDNSITKSMEIIQYMSRTIDDFRDFFSTGREKSDFNANDAVIKALSLVEASFKERRIVVEKEVSEEVIINGFPNEYAQVLLNILLNARDAISERQVEYPRIKISIGTNTKNGKSTVFISDNAGGIPENIIDKIFDPYFTTKGPQVGTGIGLFMSKSIIENNLGGCLLVKNTDMGAEFLIEV